MKVYHGTDGDTNSLEPLVQKRSKIKAQKCCRSRISWASFRAFTTTAQIQVHSKPGGGWFHQGDGRDADTLAL